MREIGRVGRGVNREERGEEEGREREREREREKLCQLRSMVPHFQPTELLYEKNHPIASRALKQDEPLLTVDGERAPSAPVNK